MDVTIFATGSIICHASCATISVTKITNPITKCRVAKFALLHLIINGFYDLSSYGDNLSGSLGYSTTSRTLSMPIRVVISLSRPNPSLREVAFPSQMLPNGQKIGKDPNLALLALP